MEVAESIPKESSFFLHHINRHLSTSHLDLSFKICGPTPRLGRRRSLGDTRSDRTATWARASSRDRRSYASTGTESDERATETGPFPTGEFARQYSLTLVTLKVKSLSLRSSYFIPLPLHRVVGSLVF